MDYRRHYDALIDRARRRKAEGFVERHHVVPKCLGGDDHHSNIVTLTPEEHYVAHQLLVKIHPGDRKLVYAAWAMTHGKRRSNKKYGWLKRKRSEAQKGIKHSAEAREKISAAAKGRKMPDHVREILHASRRGTKNSPEHIKKSADGLRGKTKTPEHRAALSVARINMEYTPELREKLAANRGKKLNENQRAALLAATKGIKHSDEHRQKVSAAKKGKLQPIITCPHCQKEGGVSLMKRWHFDNCKVKHG